MIAYRQKVDKELVPLCPFLKKHLTLKPIYKMKKILFLLFAISMIAVSCDKDPIVTPPVDNPITKPTLDNFPSGNAITASVQGIITSETGELIENATVSFGNKSTNTDKNGVYSINNASVSENYALVHVESDSYFNGNRTFAMKANSTKNVNIQLFKKTEVGTVMATGGIVGFEGVELDFPAGAIVDADGNAYTGTTTVFAKYIDPTADDITENIPGGLSGWDQREEEAVLKSYGMLAVELEDEMGNHLNIADGQSVKTTMPVPESLLSTAPATIPVWSFDETVGVWVEEEEGTLVGSAYEIAIPHFSFWNCDVPFEAACVEGIISVDGNPINDVAVAIIAETPVNGVATGFGVTNLSGWYGGKVPANIPLVLEVRNDCGEVVASVDLGELTGEVDLGIIDVPVGSFASSFRTVTGTLLDCDLNPISEDGYIRTKTGESQFSIVYPESDGSFELLISTCLSTEFEIIGANNITLLQSTPATFDFGTQTTFNVGAIVACDEAIDQYVTYTLDGEAFTITENVWVYDSTGTNVTLYAYGNNQTTNLQLNFDAEVGTGYLYWDIFVNGIWGDVSNDDVEIEITLNEGPGGKVEGSFEGDFDDNNGVNHEVSGIFSALWQ